MAELSKETITIAELCLDLRKWVAWQILERAADDWEQSRGKRINHIWFSYSERKAVSHDDDRFNWTYLSQHTSLSSFSLLGIWERSNPPVQPSLEFVIRTLDDKYADALKEIAKIADRTLAQVPTKARS